MILLIDNYDSFTYNLAQALQILGSEVTIVRNDAVEDRDLESMHPSHLVVSPGPGTPEQSGVTMQAIRHFSGKIPVLGVCLGHQALGQCFGAELKRAPKPMHGKLSKIYHDGRTIYNRLRNPFEGMLYHSLILEDLPPDLEVSARSMEGGIMGIRHRRLPLEGVQFHPESILTEYGSRLLQNFLAMGVRV
jgi:anthranilate synthase/aminodeoxychorismate synthase-like glutamine amidotransferase